MKSDPDIAYPEQHIQELVKTINTLRAERDEARREVCELKALNFDRVNHLAFITDSPIALLDPPVDCFDRENIDD